ncbi:MAG: ABC transporter substrate-binding protein [Thermoflexales bacterium]|nr:ABC transporter substrate-binding protein [Thermoflexales bacterium]
MHKWLRLLSQERTTVALYVVVAACLLALYLLLGLVRGGGSIMAAPVKHVEVAVLVPLSGPQAPLGHSVLSVVQRVTASSMPDLKVTSYDTRGTPEGAAQAASLAALEPATIAVIGPLDARQVLAAAETLRGDKLALITPASTAPVLKTSQYPGLYRIPSTDDAQGQAVASFLRQSLHRTQIFLIAESSSASVQGVLRRFDDALANTPEGQLRIARRLDVEEGRLPADLGRLVADSQADVVVYLGGTRNAQAILKAMNAAGLQVPLVGIDAMDVPSLSVTASSSAAHGIYYTSPILDLTAAPEETALASYRQALGSLANAPFAYETAQAVWLVTGALSQAGQNPAAARGAVWRNLAGSGTLSNRPAEIYVYQATAPSSPSAGWHSTLVHVARTEEGTPSRKVAP